MKIIVRQNKKTGKLKIIKHSKILVNYCEQSDYFTGRIGDDVTHTLYAVEIKAFIEVTK